MEKKRLILILIIIFAIVLRLYFFTGIHFNDDLVYVNFAHDIVEGNFKPHPYIFATRLMMIYPIAFFFLFSISEITASLYILLTSIGSVLLSYLIGKELFNEETGLIASFLLAILPLETVFSTTIVPDIPMAFFLTLSIYLFIMSNKRHSNKLDYLAGISLGLAWLVRSFAIIYAIVFIFNYLYEIFIKKHPVIKTIKPYLYLVSGLLTIMLFEGILYASLGHSFFTGLTVNSEFYSPNLGGVNSDLRYYPNQLFNSQDLGPYFHYLGFYFYLAILSIIVIIGKRHQDSYILLFWFIPILLFLQFGSMNLHQYLPIHKLYRYLTMITVPMCLIIAHSLVHFRFRLSHRIKPAIVILLLLSSLFYTYNANQYMYKSALDLKLSARFLGELEDKPIYADETTIGYYNFLFSYKRSHLLRKLDDVKSIDEIKDAYVVVYSNRGYVELPHLRSKLPDFIFNPPQGWQILRVITESDIDVYKNYNTIIYYVP